MIPLGTFPHTHARPIGPEHREQFMARTVFAIDPAPIGWLYFDATGWAVRAEITDPTWLDLADLPRKRRAAAVLTTHTFPDPRPRQRTNVMRAL